MAHNIAWDNQGKTVVLQQHLPPPNKEDLLQLAEKSAELLKSVAHTVHLIIDERSVRLMLSTTDLQNLERFVPPNQGTVVVVVAKKDVPYKMLTQNHGKVTAPKSVNRTYFAASIEEAREILQRQVSVQYP